MFGNNATYGPIVYQDPTKTASQAVNIGDSTGFVNSATGQITSYNPAARASLASLFPEWEQPPMASYWKNKTTGEIAKTPLGLSDDNLVTYFNAVATDALPLGKVMDSLGGGSEAEAIKRLTSSDWWKSPEAASLAGAGVARGNAGSATTLADFAPVLAFAGGQALMPFLGAAGTGAVVGGGTAALTGGDPLKGALLGGAGGHLGGELLSGGSDPAALQQAASDYGWSDAASLGTSTPNLDIGGLANTGYVDTLGGATDVTGTALPTWSEPVYTPPPPAPPNMTEGIDDLTQLGYPQNSFVDPMTGSVVPGTTVPVTDWTSNSPQFKSFMTDTLGFSGDIADKVISGVGKLDSSISKDPLKAAQIAMVAGGLLGSKVAAQPEEEAPYVPTPIDQSIVNKYGKVPAMASPNYQQMMNPNYQGFQTTNLPQGLLEQRLNKMRGIL
jgi:hypothetical protein